MSPVFEKVVTFAPLVAIVEKLVPFIDRCILNPVSLFELSVHDRLIRLEETAVAVRLLGAVGG